LPQATVPLEGKKEFIIFTDGSYSSKTMLGGCGIVFPYHPKLNASIPLGGKKQTNNRAEIYALIYAYRILDDIYILDDVTLSFYTDSMLLYNIVENWMYKWIKNGFIKENGETIKNIDLIKKLYTISKHVKLTIYKVKAHTNGTDWFSKNNALADSLAKQARVISKNAK
jgi:ribonuclease HI